MVTEKFVSNFGFENFQIEDHSSPYPIKRVDLY